MNTAGKSAAQISGILILASTSTMACHHGEWEDAAKSPTSTTRPSFTSAKPIGVGVQAVNASDDSLRVFEASMCRPLAIHEMPQRRYVQTNTEVPGDWLFGAGVLGGIGAGGLAAASLSDSLSDDTVDNLRTAAIGIGVASGVTLVSGIVLKALSGSSIQTRTQVRETLMEPERCSNARVVPSAGTPLKLTFRTPGGLGRVIITTTDGGGYIPEALARELAGVAAWCDGLQLTAEPNLPAEGDVRGGRFALGALQMGLKGAGTPPPLDTLVGYDEAKAVATTCCTERATAEHFSRCDKSCSSFLETTECYNRAASCRERTKHLEALTHSDGLEVCDRLRKECNLALGIDDSDVQSCIRTCSGANKCK